MLRTLCLFSLLFISYVEARAAIIFQVFDGPTQASTLQLSFELDQFPTSTPQTASVVSGPFASAIIGPITYGDGALATNIFLGGFNNRIQLPLGTVLTSPASFNSVVVRQNGGRIDNNSFSLFVSGSPTAVPEPSSVALFAIGCGFLVWLSMKHTITAKKGRSLYSTDL